MRLPVLSFWPPVQNGCVLDQDRLDTCVVRKAYGLHFAGARSRWRGRSGVSLSQKATDRTPRGTETGRATRPGRDRDEPGRDRDRGQAETETNRAGPGAEARKGTPPPSQNTHTHRRTDDKKTRTLRAQPIGGVAALNVPIWGVAALHMPIGGVAAELANLGRGGLVRANWGHGGIVRANWGRGGLNHAR